MHIKSRLERGTGSAMKMELKTILIGSGHMIQNYNDFVNSLLDAGFSMGGGNSEGIFSVVSWNWDEAPPL